MASALAGDALIDLPTPGDGPFLGEGVFFPTPAFGVFITAFSLTAISPLPDLYGESGVLEFGLSVDLIPESLTVVLMILAVFARALALIIAALSFGATLFGSALLEADLVFGEAVVLGFAGVLDLGAAGFALEGVATLGFAGGVLALGAAGFGFEALTFFGFAGSLILGAGVGALTLGAGFGFGAGLAIDTAFFAGIFLAGAFFLTTPVGFDTLIAGGTDFFGDATFLGLAERKPVRVDGAAEVLGAMILAVSENEAVGASVARRGTMNARTKSSYIENKNKESGTHLVLITKSRECSCTFLQLQKKGNVISHS